MTTGKGKHKYTKLKSVGSASFSLPAVQSETVSISVGASGRSALKSVGGHLSGTLVILKRSPAPSKTLTDTVHVSQKPAKRKK